VRQYCAEGDRLAAALAAMEAALVAMNAAGKSPWLAVSGNFFTAGGGGGGGDGGGGGGYRSMSA